VARAAPASPQINGTLDLPKNMSTGYSELGICSWGRSIGVTAHASWPTTRLHIARELLTIEAGFWPFRRVFRFRPPEVRVIYKRKGLLTVSVDLDHDNMDYPLHLVYSTWNYEQLRTELEVRGYEVIDNDDASSEV